MMEKNGNTLAPGDDVALRGAGTKTAGSGSTGKVVDLDVDRALVLVKWASGRESWESFDEIERT